MYRPRGLTPPPHQNFQPLARSGHAACARVRVRGRGRVRVGVGVGVRVRVNLSIAAELALG